VAGRIPARFAWLTAALLAVTVTHAGEPPSPTQTIAQTVTIAGLFPTDEARRLAPTMRTDRKVTFRVRVPAGPGPHGVLVFVHPGFNAQPMTGWADVLDRRDLAYIAAEGFGNDKPGDQRALAALLALTHLSRTQTIDGTRRYIGGMSGGGKMATQVMSLFPAFFDGALCIVGANPIVPEPRLAPQLAGKRIVFVTGNKDFNHYDVVAAYKRLVADGRAQAHLVDLPGFGHQYPDAGQLDAALALLDPRPEVR
jgi:predicted esterase